MMTQRLLHTVRFGLLIAAFSTVSACSAGAGTSPTQNPMLGTQIALAQEATITPTRTATPSGTQPYGFGPIVGSTMPVLSELPSHSATPLAVATQPGAAPTYGAIIGTGYTPPPSMTPYPTSTFAAIIPATSGAPTATFGALIDPNYTPPPTQTTAPQVIPNVTLPPVATDAPPVAPSVLRSALMGIQIHANLTDYEWAGILDHAQNLGVGWIKVQVAWSEAEPQQGVMSERYKGLVLQIQRAHLRGFHTLLNVAKAPAWARPNGAASVEDGPPSNAQDFAAFVGRLVADIKPEFIDAIEVWNEPNLQREWRDKPISGAEYMVLFRPTYDAIIAEQQKQPAQHRIMVIMAGPAPTFTSASGSSLDDRTWLQQIYDAGAGKYGDDVAIGAHPYGWVNPPEATCCEPQPGAPGWYEQRVFYFRDTIDDYRAIMLRNSDELRKLWVTEFGWATFDGLKRSDGSGGQAMPEAGWQGVLTQTQQADYTLRAFSLAEHDPYYAFMGPMILWNLNFATLPGFVDNSREESAFSLLDQSGTPRLVFRAIQNAPKQ
jgi:polysaccharide biosynthesis protein PslG